MNGMKLLGMARRLESTIGKNVIGMARKLRSKAGKFCEGHN